MNELQQIYQQLALTDSQLNLLNKFKNLFLEYNKQINLSSIRTADKFDLIHLLDSLLIFKAVKFTSGASVLDVGTGGGLPGIVLAIAFPNNNFTLLDANIKKITFCNYAIETLGLNNIKTLKIRAEQLLISEDKRFDYVISRATAPLSILLELTCNLVKINGQIILYKGKNYLAEQPENSLFVSELGLYHQKTITSILSSDEEINRVFLIYDKKRASKQNYPRSYAQIKTQPL